MVAMVQLLLLLLHGAAVSTAAAACGPPPRPPYPAPTDLPVCTSFPDPFLKADGSAVKSMADWTAHRNETLALLSHYMCKFTRHATN